jgi:hypothetical protein
MKYVKTYESFINGEDLIGIAYVTKGGEVKSSGSGKKETIYQGDVFGIVGRKDRKDTFVKAAASFDLKSNETGEILQVPSKMLRVSLVSDPGGLTAAEERKMSLLRKRK